MIPRRLFINLASSIGEVDPVQTHFLFKLLRQGSGRSVQRVKECEVGTEALHGCHGVSSKPCPDLPGTVP